jgi:hypothetical protein
LSVLRGEPFFILFLSSQSAMGFKRLAIRGKKPSSPEPSKNPSSPSSRSVDSDEIPAYHPPLPSSSSKERANQEGNDMSDDDNERPNTSGDEALAKRLFVELNRDLMGIPGDGGFVDLTSDDSEDCVEVAFLPRDPRASRGDEASSAASSSGRARMLQGDAHPSVALQLTLRAAPLTGSTADGGEPSTSRSLVQDQGSGEATGASASFASPATSSSSSKGEPPLP